MRYRQWDGVVILLVPIMITILSAEAWNVRTNPMPNTDPPEQVEGNYWAKITLPMKNGTVHGFVGGTCIRCCIFFEVIDSFEVNRNPQTKYSRPPTGSTEARKRFAPPSPSTTFRSPNHFQKNRYLRFSYAEHFVSTHKSQNAFKNKCLKLRKRTWRTTTPRKSSFASNKEWCLAVPLLRGGGRAAPLPVDQSYSETLYGLSRKGVH